MDWGKGCTEYARNQPNNDVRMALEDGSGGGASFCMGDSSSAVFSGLVILFGRRSRLDRRHN